MALYYVINTVIFYLIFAFVSCEELSGNVYVEKHIGFSLHAHAIRKMTSSDVFLCIAECRKMSKCWSLNVVVDSNQLLHCELNSAIRSSDIKNFVSTGSENQYLELVSVKRYLM